MDIFDTNVLNLTQEFVVPAVEVDGKAGVKESVFVFSVVIVPASSLSRLEIVVVQSPYCW